MSIKNRYYYFGGMLGNECSYKAGNKSGIYSVLTLSVSERFKGLLDGDI
jgi:hypothetical protein